MHAAGLVLSNLPVTNYTTTMEREVPKGSGNIVRVVALDKWGAARQGLLKMDSWASTPWACCTAAASAWACPCRPCTTCPWTTPRCTQGSAVATLSGTVQFEGRSTRYVTRAIKPEKFGG